MPAFEEQNKNIYSPDITPIKSAKSNFNQYPCSLQNLIGDKNIKNCDVNSYNNNKMRGHDDFPIVISQQYKSASNLLNR